MGFRLAVIGAGWSGLAAALEALALGAEVTLFEMAPAAGGRARDLNAGSDDGLDNGQHICIGAYSETLRLMATVGVAEGDAFLRLPLRLVDARGLGLRLPSGQAMPAFIRGALGRRGWSFPQGAFPHGQTGTPEELARTELAQETGLRAVRLQRLGVLAVAHGMASQYGEHWLATDLTQGEPDLEPEELGLRHAWVSRDEFETMTRDGRIVDSATLAAYALLLMAERRGEVSLR